MARHGYIASVWWVNVSLDGDEESCRIGSPGHLAVYLIKKKKKKKEKREKNPPSLSSATRNASFAVLKKEK